MGELNLAAKGRNNDSKLGGPHSGEWVLNLTLVQPGAVSLIRHAKSPAAGLGKPVLEIGFNCALSQCNLRI